MIGNDLSTEKLHIFSEKENIEVFGEVLWKQIEKVFSQKTITQQWGKFLRWEQTLIEIERWISTLIGELMEVPQTLLMAANCPFQSFTITSTSSRRSFIYSGRLGNDDMMLGRFTTALSCQWSSSIENCSRLTVWPNKRRPQDPAEGFVTLS